MNMMHIIMYNEDDWTDRLTEALNFHPLLTSKVCKFNDQSKIMSLDRKKN